MQLIHTNLTIKHTCFDDDIKKLKGEDFLKIVGIQKGELDILDGSIPAVQRLVLLVKEKKVGTKKSYIQMVKK